MEKQVLNSPFIKKEYLNLVKQFNDEQDKIFDDFAISDKTIVNIGNRDFVDYRPTINLSDATLLLNFLSLKKKKYLTFLFPNIKTLKVRKVNLCQKISRHILKTF